MPARGHTVRRPRLLRTDIPPRSKDAAAADAAVAADGFPEPLPAALALLFAAAAAAVLDAAATPPTAAAAATLGVRAAGRPRRRFLPRGGTSMPARATRLDADSPGGLPGSHRLGDIPGGKVRYFMLLYRVCAHPRAEGAAWKSSTGSSTTHPAGYFRLPCDLLHSRPYAGNPLLSSRTSAPPPLLPTGPHPWSKTSATLPSSPPPLLRTGTPLLSSRTPASPQQRHSAPPSPFRAATRRLSRPPPSPPP